MNRSAPRSVDQYLRQLREEALFAKTMLVARIAHDTPRPAESAVALSTN